MRASFGGGKKNFKGSPEKSGVSGPLSFFLSFPPLNSPTSLPISLLGKEGGSLKSWSVVGGVDWVRNESRAVCKLSPLRHLLPLPPLDRNGHILLAAGERGSEWRDKGTLKCSLSRNNPRHSACVCRCLFKSSLMKGGRGGRNQRENDISAITMTALHWGRSVHK